MGEYQSIKNDVLMKLEIHLTEIRERFDIETLSLFGSVSRGTDTPDSDIDILYRFQDGRATLDNLDGLELYLERLFERKIDLVPEKWLNPYLRLSILNEAISI